jgi:tRNA(adenine34) deaminase
MAAARSMARRARRRALLRLSALFTLAAGGVARAGAAEPAGAPERRFMALAFEMRRRALAWGDQPYGAVLVLDGEVVGEGPSRVVLLGDADAHAEREAIRDAQRRLGRTDLAGAVLYSTSRPCSRCERVAAQAQVARMIHGAELHDAGPPEA